MCVRVCSVCVCVCMRCVCICVCVSCRLLSTCALTKCCGVTCPTYYIVDKLRCFTHLLRHSLKIPHNSPIFCLTLSKSRYFPQLYSSVQALIICFSLMFPGCPLHLTKVPPSSSLSWAKCSVFTVNTEPQGSETICEQKVALFAQCKCNYSANPNPLESSIY